MAVEVEVISKEIIKPSSPTPNHLRHHQFSYLDQIAPSIYSSLVLFFEFNGETQPNITEISNHLKKSLAEVLTIFYPLAGRSHYNLYIDCNDQGIPFLEARVNYCKLSDVLHNPIPDEVNKLVPFDLVDGDNNIPLGVQLNVFECGGFAIGQCVSHKIADALSMLMFSKAWAATTRRALGDHQVEIQHPEFVAATLFPTKLFAQQLEPRISVAKNKVTKRFVFDASNIEVLRAKYVGIHENQVIRRPSRFETLSAFISSRFAAVTEYEKLHSSIHAVNLRPRFDPPLPLHYFGNLVSGAGTAPSLLNTRGACYGMARQVREAISRIDKGYIKKLQGGAGHMSRSLTGDEVVASFYTSLCKFPLYDNDFGWGRPSWVSVGSPGFDLFDNVVIFVDTRDADGIEACITSPKEVFTKLESDTEFLGRVRPICVGSGLSSTHHRSHLQMSGHRGNRPSMIKKPTAQTKPVTWGAGSVNLFGLAVKVLKKKL
ncbi:hypothetical protein M0R45_021617 [Rubus argutus]|uniref:Uncharacterized protein n=1 Tax=Rubus argutus TaxID=59490 RepID=A0AAW1XE49_RUBAR